MALLVINLVRYIIAHQKAWMETKPGLGTEHVHKLWSSIEKQIVVNPNVCIKFTTDLFQANTCINYVNVLPLYVLGVHNF